MAGGGEGQGGVELHTPQSPHSLELTSIHLSEALAANRDIQNRRMVRLRSNYAPLLRVWREEDDEEEEE